jgi:hypothetical protein
MQCYDHALTHNILCTTTNWTVSHPPADVSIFATSLYCILVNIHCISVPATTLTHVAFPWNRDFQLFCLFLCKTLRAITVYDISSLWRDIWEPSVHCLYLIVKVKFFSKPSTSIPWNLHYFIQVSVAARYRLKSTSQKYYSILLRCTRLNFSKLCYIAELTPEIRITCDLLQSEPLCAAHCLLRGFRGGWCDSRRVCRCRS